jgi:Ca2+-transporting ATPase
MDQPSTSPAQDSHSYANTAKVRVAHVALDLDVDFSAHRLVGTATLELDGAAPALTLGVEPAERGVMRRPPHPPSESIFARGLGRHVLWVGLLMGSLTLGVGYAYWRAGDPGWQTMVFTTLAFAQMAHVLAIRAEEDSTLAIGLFSNRWLAAAVLATIGLQLAVVYVPGLNALFDTVPLSLPDLGLCGLLACVVFAAVEIEKWAGRLARRR